jgi:hypothetical protein
MEDDYEIIKNAFSNIRFAKLQEDRDVEGNPILRVEIGKVNMTFYFDVDDYRDIAKFSSLIVVEMNKNDVV